MVGPGDAHAAPGGLQKRSLDSHLDQMAKLGFNMMRLPFAGATLYGSTYPQPGACPQALNFRCV